MTDISISAFCIRFSEATWWGALAGTLCLTIVLAIASAGDVGMNDILGGLILIGLFASVFTLAGMIVIGLPLTFVLHAIGWERTWLYAALGGIAGALVMVALFDSSLSDLPAALAFAGPGGLAGFVSAFFWGRWREKVAAAPRPQNSGRHADRASQNRTNPIHELIH